MARPSIKVLLRFRNPFLSHPTLIPSGPNNLFSSSSPFFFSSSSSDFGLDPNTVSVHHTLNLLKTCQNMAQLFQIQAQLLTSALFQSPSFAGRILKLSADFGDLDYTLLIFRCIALPDTFCINAVIKAYALSSIPNHAVVFYFEMLKNGFLPNSFTFPSLLSSCAKMRCLGLGQKCHGQAVKNGVNGVLPVENSLIHMYACCGLIEIARLVFTEMSVRDLVSWNSMVDAFVKFGDLNVAHKLFDLMPYRNVISWNVLIAGYLNVGNPGCGLKLFRQMVGMGLKSNDTTMVTVVTACGRSARLKEGKSVHGSLVRTFLNLSLIIDTALIDMYSKCHRANIARIIFDRMPMRNLVCWNAMILGHCLHGNPEDGLNLFAEMPCKTRLIHGGIDSGDGIKPDGEMFPDEITYVGVLCACVREGLLTEGRSYFSQMTDVFGIRPTFAHYWCMANLLASVGLVQEAVETLRNMPQVAELAPESSLWAVILGLCRFKGDVAFGEQIAKALIEQDPLNESYYALLLNVFAVAGRWEDVARTKDIMKDRGLQRMLGCSLAGLKEIVHSLKVGDEWIQNIQDINMSINH